MYFLCVTDKPKVHLEIKSNLIFKSEYPLTSFCWKLVLLGKSLEVIDDKMQVSLSTFEKNFKELFLSHQVYVFIYYESLIILV